MNQKQLEVIEWWYSKRNYRTGIELLSRYCKNKTIINTLSKHGKENFPASVKKLNYEVTKAVQLDWLHMPDDMVHLHQTWVKSLPDISPRENQKEEKNNPADTSFPPEKNQTNDDSNQYPRVIRKLKYGYAELYNKKSKLHANMRNVEQANTTKNNELRSGFLAEIKSISKQLSFYYGFLKKYENTGIVPDEAEVWPPAKEPAPEKPKTLEMLKKFRWALHRLYLKDISLLTYQSRKKAEKENPMPRGAKRDAIEQRIKLREIEINETLSLINQMENAD